MNFYSRFIELCNQRGITPSRAALEAGLSKPTVTGWKNGKASPTDSSLLKIAKYFDINISDLMDEEKTPPPVEAAELDEKKAALRTFISAASEEELEDLMDYSNYLKSKRKS